ncbi:uncharacterized protein LY89DRAFT_551756, partial [Mollisia scopiformis]
LSPTDLQAVRLALGATSASNPDSLIQPTHIIWPPSHLPPGLYHDVLRSLTISRYQYLLIALIFNTFLIIQLLLGASLTALGATTSSLSYKTSIIITSLAAANTVVAGLIALLHNGGLPSKYRMAWKEYGMVEMQVNEVLELGLVREGWGVDEVVEWCFGLYWDARRKV